MARKNLHTAKTGFVEECDLVGRRRCRCNVIVWQRCQCEHIVGFVQRRAAQKLVNGRHGQGDFPDLGLRKHSPRKGTRVHYVSRVPPLRTRFFLFALASSSLRHSAFFSPTKPYARLNPHTRLSAPAKTLRCVHQILRTIVFGAVHPSSQISHVSSWYVGSSRP